MNKQTKDHIFVLSSPSGGGKTTLIQRAISCFSKLTHSISATSRPPRKNEIDGVDYFFLSEEIFEKKIKKKEFAEWAEVYGNFYGTPIENIKKEFSKGNHLIMDLDVQGAMQLKNFFPEATLIFIMPPSIDELKKRLTNRCTESEEEINKRLETAKIEIGQKKNYDYIVTNENIEEATKELIEIIKEKLLMNREKT
ncbi:MAG: guanylate kinase [Nitrospinota bacterium]|nr:guanylate kinase [Nitrospinota bacterium]